MPGICKNRPIETGMDPTSLGLGARGVAQSLRRWCVRAIFAVCAIGTLLTGLGSAGAQPAQAAQPVRGDIRVSTKDGYARIVVELAEEVESDVKVAGGIVIVSYKQPIDIPADRIPLGAPDYVGAARRDPDGLGLRIALSRKVTVNSMAAGERLFIDLLPDTWKGMPPGLPQEVIEELARRAREAEKQLRAQRQLMHKTGQKLARVRVATQPTFTRYVFELPDVVSVTSDRSDDGFTLSFGLALKFDLADARAVLPATVKALESSTDRETTTVRFVFNGKVDVRTFREDNNYVVDIGASDAREATFDPAKPDSILSPARLGDAKLGLDPPQTVPARNAPAPPPPAVPPSAAAGKNPAAAPAERSAVPVAPAQEKPAAPAQKSERSEPEATTPALTEKPAPPAAKRETEPPPVVPAALPLDSPASAKSAEATRPDAPSAPKAPAAKSSAQPAAGSAPIAAALSRSGDNLKVSFPFVLPTPAAIFRRADTLWLVFDTMADLDLSAVESDASGTIRSASAVRSGKSQIVRVVLERPRLVSAAAEGPAWSVTIGDAVPEPTRPLGIARNVAGLARASITIPFDDPRNLHRFPDPDIGDTLIVVTALGPARGFIKAQDFVEFRALPSTHGVVLQPLADDVQAEASADKVVIGRPAGLTISGTGQAPRHSAAFRPAVFDPQLWGFDRQSSFTERQYKLIAAAADAADQKRNAARLELARFYLAQDFFAEAKAVLDIALADERPTADDPTALVLRAIANIMLGRPDAALKDLSDPLIGNQYDAPLWRAFAYARQGKWVQARQGFRNVEAAIATLPMEFQRLALKETVRAAIEVRDFDGAAHQLHEFETIGMPRRMQASLLVLSGRLAQGLGKTDEALKQFRAAADSTDGPSAAEARLREIALRYGVGEIKRADVITELETLTTLWRGDETEIEALQLLARLYTEEGRYRDAFHVMRTALNAHPNSELTRRIHDEAAVTFDALFLAGKGDALPAIDALSLFYDYRELTPIGRRGDEMIRRLADRLVAVDLLDQAAELLQYQIDNRLQGAARAQVATRLAVIYLMNRKPQRAQAILKATRVGELPTELRNLRLLLEARALSDIGRHDLALEVIANIERRDAIRLRADILWSAKRYGEAAEQIELLHGERWRDFATLGEAERGDLLRAAIGYALAQDRIGLGRLRERYAAKMAEGADRRAFEVATNPNGSNAAEFRELAKMVAAGDTLEGFLRELRASFPEVGAISPGDLRPAGENRAKRAADPTSTGSVGRAQ
jgi:tetratricopeptide (TPR) repeat protein